MFFWAEQNPHFTVKVEGYPQLTDSYTQTTHHTLQYGQE